MEMNLGIRGSTLAKMTLVVPNQCPSTLPFLAGGSRQGPPHGWCPELVWMDEEWPHRCGAALDLVD